MVIRHPEPWHTVSSRYDLREPGLFNVRRDHIVGPGDREIDGYVVIELSPWVTVVPVTEDGDLVLIRQYRHALGLVELELPGGGFAEGEDSIEAGRRELLEETGYGGGSWRSMLTVAPNPAIQNNWDHFVVAEGLRKVAEPSPDSTEDIAVELHPAASVLELIRSGQIVHALHVAALLAWLAYA